MARESGTRAKTWQDLILLDEIIKGDATPVTFKGLELAVFDTLSGVKVAHARCTHGAANLCDGYFNGNHIECPLHQGLFNAITGKAVAAPARLDLKMIDARVLSGMVQIFIR